MRENLFLLGGSVSDHLPGGGFCSLRCRVRRCMLSARAVAETLLSCSCITRWLCSHSRVSILVGCTENGALPSASWLKAATISSALAGFARYCVAPSLMASTAVLILA